MHLLQVMKENYPAGFTVKESSALHGEVKERKIGVKKPKVEGETMKLKMKDIVHAQLEALGNPVSFCQATAVNEWGRGSRALPMTPTTDRIDELPVHADWLAVLDLGQRSQGGPLG